MTILSDQDIAQLSGYDLVRNLEIPTEQQMISPFIPRQIKTRQVNGINENVVSYGLSSAGYDVSLDRQFKIFTNVYNSMLDPLNMKDDYYVNHEGDFCIIPPNGYILGITKETFNIPKDVMVIAVGKSTIARCAGIVNVTPIEPGWKGRVVIEVANASSVPLKIYSGMGIAQFIFMLMKSPCVTSYADRNGKYQGQNTIVTAKV